MKKLLSILLLFSLGLSAQVSKNRLKTSGYEWANRVVPTNAYLDSTFSSFWMPVGNAVSTNTNFIGTTSNNDWLGKSNNLTRFKIGANGINTFYADSTTYNIPLIIEGGNTVNGANPYMQLQGYYLGAYRIKNSTTGRFWSISNMSYGADLDIFSIGRTTNPSLATIKIDTSNRVTIGGVGGTRGTASLNVVGTMSVSSTATLANSNILGTVNGSNTLTIHTGGSGYINGTRIMELPSAPGIAALYFNQSTPTTTNYALCGQTGATNLNSSANVNIGIGNQTKIRVVDSGVLVGQNLGAVNASASLHVVGTVSVSGTTTVGDIFSINRSSQGNVANLATYAGTANVNNFQLAGDATNSVSIINARNNYSLAIQLNDANRVLLSSNGLSVATTATLQNNSALGSATLAGGNSGTLAVLSDAVFSMYFNGGNSTGTLSDATTYYVSGTGIPMASNTSATIGRINVPYNCTLVGYSFNNYVNGVLSTNESIGVYVRVNNTTDITLTTAATFSAVGSDFNSMALNTNLSAGDLINIKVVTPTWATNPSNIFTGVTLYFVRR